MTRAEMIVFLRENLNIFVDIKSLNYGGKSTDIDVSVKLILGEEVISQDTNTVTIWHAG
jgi:hypothetical protein